MDKLSKMLIRAGIGLLGTSVFVNSFFYTVDAGERVLIYDRFRGLQEKPIGEGMHFYIPGLQTPKFFQIRLQPKTISS